MDSVLVQWKGLMLEGFIHIYIHTYIHINRNITITHTRVHICRVNTLLYVDEKRYSIPMIISAGMYMCMYICMYVYACLTDTLQHSSFNCIVIHVLIHIHTFIHTYMHLCLRMYLWIGYVSEGEERGILDGSKQQPRFESADVYYEETYGEPLHLQGGEEPARWNELKFEMMHRNRYHYKYKCERKLEISCIILPLLHAHYYGQWVMGQCITCFKIYPFNSKVWV